MDKIFREGHHILSPGIWSTTFTDWFKNCSDGYVFSNTAIHRMRDALNILFQTSCSASMTSQHINVKKIELRTKNFLK